MASAASLPVFMRLGLSWEPVQIGSVELPVSGDGRMTFERAAVAEMLRAAADEIEHPTEDDEGAADDAPA
ncbi:hypothetical protein [Streptomyces sp. WAC 06738]|uniref:hypothetical protein n=1 Tax=Streptomyces sp. WAC 06738 TaxID=2203210 RepID=UPI000F7B9926|nr:hypothetical protein [Streptomyces sp. WAC 06738]